MIVDVIWALLLITIQPNGEESFYAKTMPTRHECMVRRSEALANFKEGQQYQKFGYAAECVPVEMPK
jgi:hypothetical protein